MNIIRADQTHIPGLLRLLHQVGQVHHDIRPDIFRDRAIKYEQKDLEELLRDETSPIFVAAEADQVLGYCFCQIRDYRGSSVLTDRKEIYIDDLCVEEALRGRGIARSLYEYTCRWAKELGCSFVTLNVWEGNEGAWNFYRKMGMTTRSTTLETGL